MLSSGLDRYPDPKEASVVDEEESRLLSSCVVIKFCTMMVFPSRSTELPGVTIGTVSTQKSKNTRKGHWRGRRGYLII